MSTPDPAGTDSDTPTESGGPDGEEPRGAVATGAAGDGGADTAPAGEDRADVDPQDAAPQDGGAEDRGADGGDAEAETRGGAEGADAADDEGAAANGTGGREADNVDRDDEDADADGPSAGKDAETSADTGTSADTTDTDENGGPGDDPGEDGGDRSAPASRSSVFDFLPSPVFLLVLGVTAFAGWFSWTRWEETQDLYEYGGTPYAPFVFILGAWIVSVAVHEFAHALVGYLCGDRGLRGSAYLRLNPFAYRERRVSAKGETGGGAFTGLVMPAVFVVLGGIGLTGPASYVNREALGGRGRRMLAPLAGIIASLVLAAAFAVAVMLLVPAGMVTDNWFIGGLMFLGYLNLTVALVNLLPIPGLDGYGILVPLLEAATASPRRFEAMERAARGFGLFGVIAVFGVLWFNVVNMAYINAMTGFFQKIGMPQMDIFFGELLMRFWLN